MPPFDGDPRALAHEQRVSALLVLQQQRAALDAAEARLLHAMHIDPLPNADGTSALDKEWVREDVACVLKIASTTAGAKLQQASDLVTRFPATLALLAHGEIPARHAYRLVEACAGLPDYVATAVEARVLPRAPQQSIAQFAVSVRRAVLACDPRRPEDRLEDALAGRRVVFSPQPDGITELWASLPAPDAAAIEQRIHQLAAQWKGLDERTGDQRRADALIGLMLGNTAASIDQGTGRPSLKPAVNVTVALSTLLDLDSQPGELAGYGPIPAAVARALAFDPTGTWRRLLTDENGNLVDVSVDTYRPPAAMARFVTLRQRTCSFRGCRRRAEKCELDHVIPWCEGGETCPANLQPLCQRHHHAKHDAGWTATKEPDGTTTWIAPSGHTYARPPDESPLDRTTELSNAPDVDPDPPPF